MRVLFRVNFISIAAMIIILAMMAGCAPGAAPQAATQSAETGLQADLTALQSSLKVLKGGNTETTVPSDQTVKVQVDDLIEVDQASRGMLVFPSFLQVELFRNAKVQIAEAKQESGGSTFVRLAQLQGHIGITLDDNSIVRMTLETGDSVINTLEEGTQFLVCKAPDKLTCLKVLKGAVEVSGQGEKQVIKAGEATFILKGQPPKPAICAPNELFIAWQDQMRKSADTPPISKLVADLPQVPCSQATAQANSLPSSAGMVKIDSGSYQVGSSTANEFHSAIRDISLDTFWIDIYEVTNAQYQQYLDQTGSPPPAVWPGEADHPVRGVPYDQAAAYCSWAKKRLPSEAEWEVAGRGPGTNTPMFPWGSNDPDAGGKITELPVDDTYPVGAYSFNLSPFGVYDMASNVWEWVGEPYDSVPYGSQILRGGRFGYIQDLAFRQPAEPNDSRFVPYAGFRCAAAQVEGK